MSRAIGVVVLVGALVGCVGIPSGPEAPLPSLSGQRVVIGTASPRMPAATMVIPVGFTATPAQGVDTEYMKIRGPGVHASLEYGASTAIEACGPTPGCRERRATVSGRLGSWVRYPASFNIEGVAYRERLLFSIVLDVDDVALPPPPKGLEINAFCVQTTDCDVVEQMALSIRFGDS